MARMTDINIKVNLEVKVTNEGEMVYLGKMNNDQWIRSDFPHPLITVDYNRDGDVIGVGLSGGIAKAAVQGMLHGIADHPNGRDILVVQAFSKLLRPEVD